MAARGRFYNLDATPDNFRAIWDQIHRIHTDLLSAQSTIRTQAATITSLQTSLDKAAKTAQQALILAGQRTSAFTGGTGGTVIVDPVPIPNHLADVIIARNSRLPFVPTIEWAFKVVQTLSWTFRNEVIDGVPFAMGLLIKQTGENIYTCGGVNYSASRVAYPNGRIFKVLSDVPTTSGAQWVDDGVVDAERYHIATDPSLAC